MHRPRRGQQRVDLRHDPACLLNYVLSYRSLEKALSVVASTWIPVAAWQVHATPMEFDELTKDSELGRSAANSAGRRFRS